MRALFGPDGARRLEAFARRRVLLAFDFDGTLAPIVRYPHLARPRATTRALLRSLARRYPCAIISSRGLRDLLERAQGTGIRRVVGDHGADAGRAAPRLAAEVRRWRGRLHEGIARIPGVVGEDKRFSVSVHYDDSPHPRLARAAIAHLARRFGKVRIVEEGHLTHVLPADGPNKAAALEREMTHAHAADAIYVGDEASDEVVFGRRDPRVLTVRVGKSRASAASQPCRNIA